MGTTAADLPIVEQVSGPVGRAGWLGRALLRCLEQVRRLRMFISQSAAPSDILPSITETDS